MDRKYVLTNKQTNRIEWIDIAKGIGIIYVMLGHTYIDSKFVFWFYAFHMALFFFLSGCTFCFKRGFVQFIKRKIRGLLIPYLFFSMLIILYNYISAVTHNNSVDVIETCLLYIKQIRYTHLWFLPCLFLSEIVLYVIYCAGEKYINRKYFFLSISLICFILFFIYKWCIGVNLPWNADLVPLGLTFMSLGQFYRNKNYLIELENKVSQARYSLIGILVVFVVVVWINYIQNDHVDWYYNNLGNPVLFLCGAVLGIAITIFVSKSCSPKLVLYLGANSILWYGLHRIVIDASFVLYNKLHIVIIKGSWSSLLFALISVALSIVLLAPINIIINKYFPWGLGKKKIKNSIEVN